MPPDIEVKGSENWKTKDMSKIEDLKTLEKTFDWSFCTPYKGSMGSFAEIAHHLNEKQVQIAQAISGGSLPETTQKNLKAELDYTSTQEIPLDMLGPDN